MASLGGFLVCLLVIGLDIAAGLCGIEAEIAQNKVLYLFFLLETSLDLVRE